MSTYINPRTDTGFKIIFGREGLSEVFLMDFLNRLFEDDPELRGITSLTFKNVEHTARTGREKNPRYDIFCETSTGHRFIVEMQRASKDNFMARADYYVARCITDQALLRGDGGAWDYRFMPVVGVFITEFFIKELPRKLLIRTQECDVETKERIPGGSRKVFVQLPAFTKSAGECVTGFEKWIYILKNMETMEYSKSLGLSTEEIEKL